MTVSEIIKKAVLAGVGAQEKTKEFIDDLVKAGELSKSEAATLVNEWIDKADQSTKDMDVGIKDAIAATFDKLNIPTRDDLERLEKKVRVLSERIAKIEGEGGQGGA
jgi:polyhydroxyalkanoate synthesis regulator phasin